jgi:hypothetical protein
MNRSEKNIFSWITVVSLICLANLSCAANKDWGRVCPAPSRYRVCVGKDSDGHWEATLENSKIRIRYGFKVSGSSAESMITDCIIKDFPDNNLAGALLDASCHRGLLTKAEIVKDSPDEKTVYLEWVPVPKSAKKHPGPARAEISIFPDSMVLKINYISFCFPHVCDIGLMADRVTDANCGGRYRIYGYEKEHFPLYEDCLYWEEDGCMGCSGEHASADGFALDPGPLNYNGWYVMGVYLEDSGLGFGRVMPVENMRVIKLLWNKGFELFPKGENVPCYLFLFTGGADDVINIGTKLADKANALKPKL